MAQQLPFLSWLLCGSMVSVWSVMVDTRGPHGSNALTTEACAELINHGTHHGVEVEVGTPGQKFDVVADTGSNTLIIPSCICMKRGACNKKDRCFIGTNRSSTFKLAIGPHGPMPLMLHFGSGSIAGVKAIDVVQVGQLKHYMSEGLMLMTNHRLNFKMSFEGILGLGIPRNPPAPTTANHSAQEIIHEVLGGGAGEGDSSLADIGSLKDAKPLLASPPGLLEQAGVHRFSMCFNDGSNGVLRLGSPLLVDSHASVGTEHWGLGLHGVSVGAAVLPLPTVCAGRSMHMDQDTPCGAIPDSGTTMIAGPRAQLSALFEAICDAWPRCKQNHTALVDAAEAATEAAKEAYGGQDPFHINVGLGAAKEHVLRLLLSDCTKWLDEGTGLGELPELHFHVAGSGGTAQTLSLSGSSYVFETAVQKGSNALVDRPKIQRSSDASAKKCLLAFQQLEYNTWKNGPVWIFGTPFFYEYQVGYDLGTKPASMSFASLDQSPCGTCDKQAGLVASDVSRASQRVRRLPRWLPGAPREPRIDVNQPL